MAKGRGNGAVLYVRVSTDEQANGPLNLSNQEKRCRDYCDAKDLPVLEVFVDRGVSARSADRPEFQRMLAYCREHRHKVGYVIVQDLSRFARNNQDQAEAIADLEQNGVLLRSTYESNIDETAAGKLAANFLGGMNQFFSDSLSERMKDRTYQAVLAGRFPWRAPIGYQNIKCREGANIVPDEERAPLIRKAFEHMATGRYRKTEVLKIVTDEGLTTMRGKPLTTQTFQAVLRNPLYAGWIVLRNYEDFEPVRGLHVSITTQRTFDCVQAILDGRKPSIVPKRKFNPSFPLKCLLRCAACDTPLTGGFCKGRNKSYGRYWCRNHSCLAVKLPSEQLEAEFMDLLRRLRPEPDDVAKFTKIAAKVWAEKEGNSEKEIRRLSIRLREQKDLKHKLLLAMLGGAVQETDYTEANERFDAEIAVIEQELRFIGSRRGTQQSFVQFAEVLLMDIALAYQLANPECRQRVQNLLFEDGLDYSPEVGILNRSKTSLFSMLETIKSENNLLASPTGFEPVLSP